MKLTCTIQNGRRKCSSEQLHLVRPLTGRTIHARFHNGQTMTLGLLLMAMSIHLAFKPALDANITTAMAKNSALYAALVGSFYCAAGLAAILYPGTDWKDPGAKHGGGQIYVFGVQLTSMWVAYGLEVSRLQKAKSA